LSGVIVLLIIFLLYRRIETIGRISVFLWAGVIVTILWIIISGFTHKTITYNFFPDANESFFNFTFMMLVGKASVKTIYSYLGYYNVCHLGGEIINPQRNIPRSIFISIFGIAILYLCMNVSIVGVVPWQEAMKSDFIVSTFMEKIYGTKAAVVATLLIMWIAFASLFAVLLGYSRVPYAAAADGKFFPVFSKLHPTKNFPYVSLLFIGGIGFVFSLLFKLGDVISAILAMRILVQFVAQAIGLVQLRRRNGTKSLPFKMWLYPLPIIFSVLTWLFVFYSTGKVVCFGLALIAIGIVVFYFTKDMWGEKTLKTESL